MLKLLIIAGWVFVAIDAFIAGAAILARDMGTDAAGRGLALGLGLVALVPLLLGGTALYFGGRAQSRLGVIASFVLLALPFLIFFGVEVEGWFHDIRVSFTNLVVNRFPDRPQRALADAIGQADFQAMRRILATHPSLNGRNKAGYDLLGYAITLVQSGDREDCRRRLEAVRLLLDAGMDPNGHDGWGSSLFSSLANGSDDPVQAEAFQLFIDHGANPNGTGKGDPPIFDAWHCVTCLQSLLDHGANMEARNANGDTPLLFFLFNGRWDGALVLLQRGADIGARNAPGTTVEEAIEGPKRWMDVSKSEGYAQVAEALERRRQGK